MVKQESIITRVCPLCKKEYKEHPALSRDDNKTLICPECGSRQALASIGVSKEEQDKILQLINKVDY